MKKYGALIALVLAVGFGLMAVVLANRWMAARSAPEQVVQKEELPVVKVVVAARELPIGTPLSAANLTLAEWPKSLVPKGAFHDLAAVENRIAVNRVPAGVPIMAAELAAPGSGAGLVATIPSGKRAMAIRVDEVSGVGGFVLPNTWVDLISVENGKGDEKKVTTILHRIKVLAIAQETFTEEGKPKLVKTVTLELEPKQAETLALHTHKGTVHLVLRNPLNEDIPKPVQVAAPAPKPIVRTVYVQPKPAPAPPPPPPPFEVEVFRRSKKESLSFQQEQTEGN
jgi:pilus assembly protein CpaB